MFPIGAENNKSSSNQIKDSRTMDIEFLACDRSLENNLFKKQNQKERFLCDKPTQKADRFIPPRQYDQMQYGSYLIYNHSQASPEETNYKCYLKESLFSNCSSFTTTATSETENSSISLLGKTTRPSNRRVLKYTYSMSQNQPLSIISQVQKAHNSLITKAKPKNIQKRILPTAPERILDAPELCDDYYLNLVDWGRDNVLAVCLGASLYLWNGKSKEISQLLSADTDSNGNSSSTTPTSVSYSQDRDATLAAGFSDATIQIWDTAKRVQIRKLTGHTNRVSSLSWNQWLLTSGGRDSTIIHHDVRIQNSILKKIENAHTQEVCGLKWSHDGSQLASGSNDNSLLIWDVNLLDNPRFVIREHKAAVKALAWCPWQSQILASGGGTADRYLKIWNTGTGALINSVDTESQVCAIVWNKSNKEILSSHGFLHNQVTVRKWPTLEIVGEMKGHESRVLHLVISPDESTLVSAGADETLRFWKLGEAEATKSKINYFLAICDRLNCLKTHSFILSKFILTHNLAKPTPTRALSFITIH